MQINKLMLVLFLIAFDSSGNGVDKPKVEDRLVTNKQVVKEKYGLTIEELKKYEEIKSSTLRPFFTPEPDPFIYLGLEAETEEERMRYARLRAQAKMENSEKVKKWVRAVQRASVELYGMGNPIDLDEAKEFMQELVEMDKQLRTPSNDPNTLMLSKTLFVSYDCDKCINVYKKLASQLSTGDFQLLEIVFVNFTKQQIFEWVKTAEIPAHYRKSKVITFKKFTEENEKDYPIISSKFVPQ